jgi:hypothetical protein
MTLWFMTKAWPWLKKNWAWIVLPVGLLILVLKAFGRQRISVVAPELIGAAEEQSSAKAEADARVSEAGRVRAEDSDHINAEHSAAVDRLVGSQAAKVGPLLEDPDALNDFLKDVGKDMRR